MHFKCFVLTEDNIFNISFAYMRKTEHRNFFQSEVIGSFSNCTQVEKRIRWEYVFVSFS